jgi:hypothetical protein
LLRFAARALLFALHDSRERAARTIIRDHRHLLPQRAGSNSFQRVRGNGRESKENGEGISRKMGMPDRAQRR